MDTRSSERVKEFFSQISEIRGKIIVYDHHSDTENNIINGEIRYMKCGANTTFLAKEIIERNIPLDPEEATIALTGIYADTVNFTSDKTTEDDFSAARYFLSQGAAIKLVKYFLQPLKKNYQISYFHSILNGLNFRNFNGHEIILSYMELENQVNGLASVAEKVFEIENPEAFFAVFNFKKEKETTIIARSQKESIKVSKILAHFGGGGHEKAASATIKKIPGEKVFSMLQEQLSNLVPDRTAQTIMTRDVKFICDTIKVSDAALFLEEIKHTAVPVLNQHHMIVGIIDSKNIKNARKAENMHAPVSAYMNKKVITIDDHATMKEIERAFLENDINHIPVINKNSELVGIVTRKDFLSFIHEDELL